VDDDTYFDNGGPIDEALKGMYVRLEVQRRYYNIVNVEILAYFYGT
jgi:hypothetical protein